MRRLLAWILVAACVLGAPAALADAGRRPLLLEHKKTLYQRVLTRPGAVLKREPGNGPGAKQPALTRFYVYARKTVNDAEWLEVGLGAKGRVDGWLSADFTLPWRQQLALAFTNPAGRDRALFYRDRDTLMRLLESDDPGKAATPLRTAVLAGRQAPGVVSIEPATHVDINRNFYLLPILNAEETFTGTGHRARVLEIASVSRQDDGGTPGAATDAKPKVADLRDFRAAVVFVIDTTISMGPYIDRTRAAVRRIADRVKAAGISDRVRFGLVAFRSSTAAAPELKYTARLYADPETVKTGAEFLEKVKSVSQATVSSPRFSEDAYAGVMAALKDVDWSAFGGRYVVLITDAGALKGGDPLSSTGLDAEQVRLEALHRGVAVYAMHLRTPEGKANHAEAEAQYRALSSHPLVPRPLYYPVPVGSVDAFGKIVDSLGDAIVAQVNAAYRGDATPGSARTSDPEYMKEGSPAERVRVDTALLGHAMQLAYLGRVEGTRAPPLFRAWICDRSLSQPGIPTTEVRVLLTRNQLSDMQQVLKAIAEAGEASQLSPGDFFSRMRSVAATLGRDPNAVNDPRATKLAALGLLGEYLDDLPYRSQVMNLDQQTWSSWSIPQQQAFIDGVNRKLRLYQVIHDDVDRWISLGTGSEPGEAVAAVPLDALP